VPGMSREAAPSAGVSTAGGAEAGQVADPVWFRTADGRVHQRGRTGVLVAAAGLA